MSKILLLGGLAFFKVWAFGFFWFHITGIIHVLLLISILALMVSYLNGKIFFRGYIPLTPKALMVKYTGNYGEKKK